MASRLIERVEDLVLPVCREIDGQAELPGVVPAWQAERSRTDRALADLGAAGAAEQRAFVARCDAITGLLAAVPLAESRSCSGYRGVVAEIALVRSVTERAAATSIGDACGLAVLPRLRRAMLAGRVGVPQARVLLDDLPDVAPAVIAAILLELVPDGGNAVDHTPHQPVLQVPARRLRPLRREHRRRERRRREHRRRERRRRARPSRRHAVRRACRCSLATDRSTSIMLPGSCTAPSPLACGSAAS